MMENYSLIEKTLILFIELRFFSFLDRLQVFSSLFYKIPNVNTITAVNSFFLFYKKRSSRPVSRVLSSAVIYLGLPLPISSSDLRTNIPVKAPIVYSYLASGGVYTASRVTEGAVSSCLAFSSLPFRAVIFCCTFLKVTFTGR